MAEKYSVHNNVEMMQIGASEASEDPKVLKDSEILQQHINTLEDEIRGLEEEQKAFIQDNHSAVWRFFKRPYNESEIKAKKQKITELEKVKRYVVEPGLMDFVRLTSGNFKAINGGGRFCFSRSRTVVNQLESEGGLEVKRQLEQYDVNQALRMA